MADNNDLLAQLASSDAHDWQRWSPGDVGQALHQCCLDKNERLVEKILEAVHDGRTTLGEAASGARRRRPPQHVLETALSYRGSGDNEAVVRALLQHRACCLSGGGGDDEALLGRCVRLACKSGRHRSLAALLDAAAELGVDGGDEENGNTGLHHAALRGSIECMQLLLERGAQATSLNQHQATPLHKLCGICGESEQTLRAVELLLSSLSSPQHVAALLQQKDAFGESPLIRTVRQNSLDTLDLLLRRLTAAGLTSPAAVRLLADVLRATRPSPAAMRRLLALLAETGAAVNSPVDDEDGASLLFLLAEDSAARQQPTHTGNDDAEHVAGLLVEAGADLLYAAPVSGDTVLHRPLLTADFLDYLAARQSDALERLVNAANAAGLLPLDVALARTDAGRCRVAHALLSAGGRAGAEQLDRHGRALLRDMCSQWQYVSSVRRLLELGCRVDNDAALMQAVKHDVVDTVTALLDAGVGVGLSAEQFAALVSGGLQAAAVGSLYLLSKAHAEQFAAQRQLIAAHRSSDDGESLLHAAVAANLPDFVPVLVQLGLDVNEAPSTLHSFSDGGTPLHLAAQKGHLDCIRVLLAHGADVNSQRTYAANTPCHAAVAFGQLPALELLLTYNPNLDLLNNDDESVLDVATESCPRAAPILRQARATNQS